MSGCDATIRIKHRRGWHVARAHSHPLFTLAGDHLDKLLHLLLLAHRQLADAAQGFQQRRIFRLRRARRDDNTAGHHPHICIGAGRETGFLQPFAAKRQRGKAHAVMKAAGLAHADAARLGQRGGRG